MCVGLRLVTIWTECGAGSGTGVRDGVRGCEHRTDDGKL